MIFKPYEYQRVATNKIIFQKRVGLFLDMGLGKTVITLSAINYLVKTGKVKKVLIIAPLRVAQTTWSDEADKWDHLNLKISKILGTQSERISGYKQKADVYVINRENIPWLCKNYNFDYDMVVIDELSSFKSPKSLRFKALKKFLPSVDRVVGLTGTPTPNGLLDLWSQIYLIDNGKALGRTMTSYRDCYFLPDKRNKHIIFSWKLKPKAEDQILAKISDLCISMTAKDYLTLPPRIDRVINVDLPQHIFSKYKDFEQESILEFEKGEATALNVASLINKLLQFSNGAVYKDSGDWEEIHQEKINALEEIVDVAQPVLCFYSYKHDLERLLERFPQGVKIETEENIREWNKGNIPIGFCHPASCGHGLNLQSGGHIIVWFGLPWSLELYQQANARLHRQGQTKPVIVHHIITKNTCDKRVLNALQKKENIQDSVLDYLKSK